MKSVFDKEEAYWNEKFDSEDSISVLPYSNSSNNNMGRVNAMGVINRTLPPELSQRIITLANGSDMAVYMIVLAGVTSLLYKYTNHENVLVGMPAYTALHGEHPPIHDFLVIKNNVNSKSTFKSLLGQIKASVSEALEHQHLPFRKMFRQLNLQVDPQGLPIVNTLVSYTNIHTASLEQSAAAEAAFQFEFVNDRIQLRMSFDDNRYRSDYVESMIAHLFRLLSVVLFQPELEIGKVELLSEHEQHHLLAILNDTRTEYPRQKTIHQLFEEQAERMPDAVAALFEDKRLTYAELNAAANRIAHLLRERGVARGTLVGISAERSLEMVIGLLGILKAGGAYVPLDPDYPEERINAMLEDTAISVLLTQAHLQTSMPNSIDSVLLDAAAETALEGSWPNLTDAAGTADDVAYIIYTSGSTGIPKGVCVTHRGVVRLVAAANYVDISSKDVFLQGSTISFDAATFEIWGCLLNGAALAILPPGNLSLTEWTQAIQQYQVTILWLTAGLFHVMVENQLQALQGVQQLLVGGDVVSQTHAKKVLERYKDIRLVNGYGPTENTTFTCCHEISAADMERLSIPIGRPIANTQVYVLDEAGKLLPVGVVGELYTGGDGLAQGYWNRPELTAEKFVDNPFVPGTRLYRTGDLARWLPYGTLEYVGRIDDQVKIRGYRIELGEVEAHLLKVESVLDAVVIARPDESGQKMLCAYYTAHAELMAGDLRAALSQDLPAYMIPTHLVQVDQMPLTPNGKVDRRALPEPEGLIMTGKEHVAPRTPLESKLAQLWQEVLGLEKVSVKDSFFEIGGHSLRATTLAGKLHKEMNVSLPLRDIFRHSTIEELARLIDGMERQEYRQIPLLDERDWYPVSSAQKRLYILHQLEGAEQSYNMPGVMLLEGQLDRNRFEEAFGSLIRRHETLRTGFEMVNGEPVQRVCREVNFSVEIMQASEEEAEAVVRSFIRPFDLEKPPLLRVGLIELDQDRHILMYDMHHIISDGVSMGIVVEEFVRLYGGEELPPLRIQYKDYAAWQQSEPQQELMKQQESYWLQALGGELPVLELPADYARPSIQSYEGDTFEFAIDPRLSEALHGVAAESGTTLYMVLLAAYTILLHKYTGQEDIIVGTPNAGRTHGDLQPLIGMFVNTLAIRNYPAGSKTFLEYLEEVKETSLGAFENQDYPFEELVEKLQVTRDLSRNPLFDTMFALQNMDDKDFELAGLRLKPYPAEYKVAKFDLSLDVAEGAEGMACSLEYATALYRPESIERMAKHFGRLLEAVAHEPEALLASLGMLTEEEEEQIRHVFNDTEAGRSQQKTVPELFEEQVERTPDRIAVVHEDKQLTYRELNERANRLARTLRAEGVKPEQLVGIMADRSLEMIVGIMAILKSGGAYVPIDPQYPEDRIHYMLDNSNAQVLLAQRHLQARAAFSGRRIMLDEEAFYGADGSNLERVNQPEHLSYVIYTSGTTGKPKGVMIEHRQMAVLSAAWEREYGLQEESMRWMQWASFSFDVFSGDLIRALLHGGELILCPEESRANPAEIYELIRKHRIQMFDVTPSLVIPLMEYVYENKLDISSMKLAVVGADHCPKEEFQKLLERFGSQMRIVNSYGVTETTIDSCYFEQASTEGLRTVPIGKPLPGVTMYILDEHHSLLPVGITGELYIGGPCVGRGYWKRPDLTAEKFVDNPFAPGERMYRTGDLARWLPDGNVEYLGRIDHQVKIRGYRIEIGEVETQLLKTPFIREAVVVAREDVSGQKSLCAYFVAERELTVSELRRALAAVLPGYMIPSYFVQLERLPLTPNGKIDRKALPAPEGSAHTGAEFVAPRTSLEAQLARIWQEVLGLPDVSVKDNFFDLGGHSLRATTLASKVFKEMHINLPLRDVFRYPTIEELAELIAGMKKQEYAVIPLAEERDVYPLSSAQKRLYIVSQLEGAELSYNMPGVITLEGPLDRTRFDGAFQQLIARHEALRTGFEMVNGEPVQRIHRDARLTVEYVQADEEEAEKLVQRFVRSFDLKLRPLLRVGLIEIERERHILMFDMHHIISDGVTMGILVDEFARLYAGEDLPPLRIQYKDYAVWQQSEDRSGELQRQEAYWLERLQGELPVLELPTDYVRPAVQKFDGDVALFTIDPHLSEQLRRLASDTGSTLYMVLLAAYTTLLHKYTGQEDIIVGTPIAGRSHGDLEPLIGMFVNTLAVRNYPASEKAFLSYLAEVKETTLGAFEHQDYPFEDLVEKVRVSRDLSRNPLFDTMFSLENAEQGGIEIEGLQLKSYPNEHMTAKFDLTFHAEEGEEGILCGLVYATALYKRDTVERMMLHFKQLLAAIAHDPRAQLSTLNMMSAQEREEIIGVFNDTGTKYPREKTIQHLFEEQVERTPNAAAIVYGDERMTYRELNGRANRLARTLRTKGVQADRLVGLMAERSLEMIVGILAILKAGGAYVPIDPEYPEERVRYMLEDSGTKIILTQHELQSRIPVQASFVLLDDEHSYSADDSNLEQNNGPADLAYVIYTSGTTGKPKGNLATHRNIVRVVQGTSYIDFSERDNVLQLSNYAFDGSTFDMYGALLNGAKLVLIPQETLLEVGKLAGLIERERISVMFITTAYFNILIDMKADCLRHIRTILFGGERVSISHVRKALYQLGPGKIKHVYGPTESTVFATCHDVNEVAEDAVTVPIGRPISNTTIYIVNAQNDLQPIGVAGELCIAGDGLARGYLNRPDLTAAKFVDNPFAPRERMYRTGDLARWLPDGSIEYVGRIDDQVKIRGYRIELGEVETHLLRVEPIQEATVIARESDSGEKRLCAYYVADRPLPANELRGILAQELPGYMIPLHFVQLDRMPLTPNGKVDRKALPAPEDHLMTGTEYVAPRTTQEAQLAQIWQEVLGIEKIGVQDNFFELGGHSINLMQLIHRIYIELGAEIALHSVFQRPTVEAMAYEIVKVEYEEKSSSQFTKLNENGLVNVFCLPPGFGYGLSYLELAKQMENSCILYGIDFIDDAESYEDMLDRYVDAVVAIQSQSPYVLLGYSLGGNLTFEIAKAMEKRGYRVSDIIMLDSTRKLAAQTVDEFESDIDQMLEAVGEQEMQLLSNPLIRERVKHKMRAYWTYGSQLVNTGAVEANIHALIAEDSDADRPDNVTSALWDGATRQAYCEHRLIGVHEDVLLPGFIEHNVKVIHAVVHQIIEQTRGVHEVLSR
ncbi:amino acid adenylation domain-containing protein [Paenibacillus sp. MER TA 81-3]|uniref:non-ribosomal peptide synthetase n=1 Tax=Paenibacillus sp. MER TA 81-3 TaxID=2939573 RepID=UPI002040BF0E|nr:non-ribosomal peptide synthetase [Paenibacillus sp. MER TA 81-3]MCM3340482.1 amino acid adenylation domain-containing protein [Paenibacillus sp. MER TA 81-3]